MARFEANRQSIEYGDLQLELLRIKIDDVPVPHLFPMFDASAESVVTDPCLECYASTRGEITFCGTLPSDLTSHDNVYIRRHNGKIFWFLGHLQYLDALTTTVSPTQIFEFDSREYEAQLSGSSRGLPGFRSEDIKILLNRYPAIDPEFGIYVLPSLKNDPGGRGLLKLIQLIRTDDAITVSSLPLSSAEIRIGIADSEFECILKVGVHGSRYCLLLQSIPFFPLWLSSDSIHNYLKNLLPDMIDGEVAHEWR